MEDKEIIDPEDMEIVEEATPEEKLAFLTQDIEKTRAQASSPSSALMRILAQDPTRLMNYLTMDAERARNVRGLVAGTGAGLSLKYLEKYFGTEIAAAIGAIGAAHFAKKLFK